MLRPERLRRLPESLADAAARGDLERMQLFLDRGAKIDHRTQFNNTPLGTACVYGQLEAARWLIAHGASLEPEIDVTPIQSALNKANCEIAALLLDAGLPIDRAAWGVPVAAMLGKLDMLLWLVGRGVDLDRSYPRLGVLRERALKDAKKDGAGEDIRRFLRREFDPGPPPKSPPSAPPFRLEKPRAAASDREPLLKEALDLVGTAGKSAANWNASGSAAPPQRQRLICFAASTGILEIVAALLDAGARPNTVPDGTSPPLTAAAEEAQIEVMKLLLERGALPNGRDGKSWLPLVSAALSGEPEAVRLLLAAGANPKAKPAGGHKLGDYVRGPYAGEIRAMLAQALPTPKASPRTKQARSKSGPAEN